MTDEWREYFSTFLSSESLLEPPSNTSEPNYSVAVAIEVVEHQEPTPATRRTSGSDGRAG
jgi:hypothetical protein